MASADGGISVKFHLPLQLLINDGKEKLHQDGQEKVFEKLLYDFQSLKKHLQENKNLNCFTLVDVSNEKGSVNLLLEVYGERQLNELNECLKTDKNLLSECLSNYFFAHNYEGVAELDDNICIECKVSMARSVYFKVLGELSEQEESKSLERSDESQTESGGFDVDTKYTGTNAKDSKPLKTYDSTCNEPQKQPGSYPAQKAPVVRKKFILMYLPEPGYVIKHIKMKSDTCPILNDVKLSLRDGNLYETEIDIPLKLIKTG